ncbi:MAG: hypothetical protein L0J63_09575, partial [Tetragenococcus koreensis]|nr:hypothetical protein [Tetragenococcus koreensis]
MKQNSRMNVRVKSLIYSSAVLAALAPAMKTEAQEAEMPDASVQEEESSFIDENRSRLINVLLTQRELRESEDVSLYNLIEFTLMLHLNEKYDAAQILYQVLDTYTELKDIVKTTLHTNEQYALNQTAPENITLSEEQVTYYQSVILLSKSEVDEVLALVENGENSVKLTEKSLENQSNEFETSENDLTEENQQAEEEDTTSEFLEIEETEYQFSPAESVAETVTEETDVSVKEDTEEVLTEIANEPEVLVDEVTEPKEKKFEEKKLAPMTTSSLSDADSLYDISVNSGSITEAWYTAIEGYNNYPNDARFKYAIEKAAVRSLNYADTLESEGDFTAALAYFGRTLDSPWLSKELTGRAQNSYDRVHTTISNEEEKRKEELYQASVGSKSVTTAWYKALEGYNAYPNDARFKYAIEKAAVRSLNYADTLESEGDFTAALAYFGRTLDSPWLTNELTNRTQKSYDRVQAIINHGEEAVKEALYKESVESGSVTTAWYKALEGYNLYPDDARFKDAIEKAGTRSLNYADSLEKKGNLSGALAYFERTLDSPWLTEKLKKRATASKENILEGVEEKEKEALYNISVQAGSVTKAWYTALEGFNKYPEDARFKDAIEKAAVRSLDYADSLGSKGQASSSIPYYDRTLDAPWMTKKLIKRATISKAQMLKIVEEEDKEALYNASVNSPYVTDAWNKALEGYNKYPMDSRFKDAIRKAAERNLNYADSLESKGNGEGAISYYDRILNAPWMPNDLYERAFKSKEEVLKYLDSDYIYQEILKEKNQIIAWEMATKAVVDHPNDKRIAEYIKTQAAKILDKAISLHKGYEYENAIRHYDLLNTGPKELYDGEEIAEKYKVLAMNSLTPNH